MLSLAKNKFDKNKKTLILGLTFKENCKDTRNSGVFEIIKNLNKKPKIAVLGLNPHCETIEKTSEEQEEIIPAIKKLRSEIPSTKFD